MRAWDSWLEPLVRRLQDTTAVTLEQPEWKRFLQVELGLRLWERLIPTESCSEVWALLTGYSLPGLHADPEARHLLAVARHRMRYVRTVTSWTRWLTWYAALPGAVRLFDVNILAGTAVRRSLGPAIWPERVEAYDAALETAAPHKPRKIAWAGTGQHHFTIGERDYSVSLPEALTALPHPALPEAPPVIRERAPIAVTVADLRRVAARLTELDPQGSWAERAAKLELTLVRAGELQPDADCFTIDGLFHLVGMVGSGKSTLIYLLTYLLAAERGLRVALLLNTVVESIQMAADLVRLGIHAAPALGMDRESHRRKYGQASEGRLRAEDQFLPDAVAEPAIDWLTAPCLLSGALESGGPIPAGSEPCRALYDARGDVHHCPALPVCPVHQAAQDLPDAQVWVLNPASFIQSQAPEGLGRVEMRLLEAVYRAADIVIIDEADRVQVQWDRKYAPVDNLAGHRDALLDELNLVLTTQYVRSNRRPIAQPRHLELKRIANEVDRLSNWVLHFLFNHPDLVEWLSRTPVTNTALYADLANDLAMSPESATLNEVLRDRFQQEFRTYYDHPVNAEGGRLARLVNDVRDGEESELPAALRAWLEELLARPLADYPESEALLRRLEFSVVLTAMDKRVDHLLHNWQWAAPEFGERRILDQSPPQEYVDLVPESPLGNLLGYQYSVRPPGGVLKYIQCHGLGRWLLLHFRTLYADLDGNLGPHVLLASATSWAPGSPQFHLAVKPDAILTAPEAERQAIDASRFKLVRVPDREGTPIRVSGLYGEPRNASLERLIHYLAETGGAQVPPLEKELGFWRERGPARKVLIVVGSYAEARRAVETFETIPGWRGRVASLQPDHDESLDAALIRRGQIEQFRLRQADILIAPLLAIQRGFNILDHSGGALLGSVYFLVRPYPVPDDLGQHVLGVNAWAMQHVAGDGTLRHPEGTPLSTAVQTLRSEAFGQWHRRLDSGRHGFDSLPADIAHELLWDQFVAVWQTIGRLVRRGRPAHVFFMDAAFDPPRGRSMVRGWLNLLEEYLGTESTAPGVEQKLAETLYGSAYRALRRMLEEA